MAAPRAQRTAEEVLAAWREASSGRDFALRLGVAVETARRLCADAGLQWRPPHWSSGLSGPGVVGDVGEVEVPWDEQQMLAYLRARGYELREVAVPDDEEYDLPAPDLDGDGSFRLGIVSDTHGGSRYEQHSFLQAAYDYFEREGIGTVLHAGDLTAGSVDMHRGMAYEQHAHGADEQADYVVATYPRREGVTTYVISGNHDHSHLKAGGVNVVRRIAEARPDIEYLGMSGAYLTVHGIRIYLHHPSGGVAYARSYKLQKLIEQFAPERKPKVLICGHWHTTCVLESYRNVYAMAAGCMEAQTPYLVERGLYPEVGFSVLTVTYNDEGAVSFSKSWHPCYMPRENDWGRV